MTLNRRILRTLIENKGRTIGIVVLILLGSFTFVVSRGVSFNMDAMVSGFAESHLQEDVSFMTGAPIADMDALEARSGAAIDSYQYADATLPDGAPLRLMTPGMKINLPAVRQGSGLESPGDILLDPYFMSMHAIKVGDAIEANGTVLTVKGAMSLPHYVYALKNIYDVMPPSGFGIGLISGADMARFDDAQMVYCARFADRTNLNVQTVKLHQLLTEDGRRLSDWVDAMNNKRIRMAWASITGLKAMSVPMPAAMFLLCCLIIGIMIWRTIRADSVVIGTLYALGYRRRELERHYMVLPLLLAALGGVLGALLGLPCIAPAVHAMLSSYYNVPIGPIDLMPVNILIAILMPMLFLGLASFFVIRKELKKTAAELMKGDEQDARINFLERSISLDRFRFKTRFRLRAQLRSVPRLLFLLIGVMGASALLLFGFTINHSMNTLFSGSSGDVYNFAYEYSFKSMQQGEVPDGAEPFNAIRCYIAGRENVEFYVTGIPQNASSVTLKDARGESLPAAKVNITQPLAQRLGLRVGDEIHFVNKLDGAAYSLRIDGIAQTYAGQLVFMPLQAFNAMAGLPEDSYSGLFADRQLPVDEKLLSGVKDLKALSTAMDDIAMPMMATVAFLTVVAGLMGALIIFLVTSLMIEESRPTISLMKVFGYRRKEIASLVLNSSTPVVVLGFLLGVPLMTLSANAMYGYLGEMINLVLPMIVSPFWISVSFVIILGVYQLTLLLCAKRLAKVSMSEALKAGTE